MSDAAGVPDHDRPATPPPNGEGPGFPSIIIQGQALTRIEDQMGADSQNECGGVLVGNAAPSTNFVLVTGSVAAQSGSPMFTAASVDALTREVATTHPGQRIVGWYHSRPGAGVFLSADDLYIQNTFFAHSWQVAYVLDPVENQRGFFGWSGREVVRVRRWEVTEMTQASDADLAVEAPAVASGLIGAPPPDASDDHPGVDDPLPVPPVTGPPLPYDDDRAPRRNRVVGVAVALTAIAAIVLAAIVINSRDNRPTTTNPSGSSAAGAGGATAVPPAGSVTTVSAVSTASTTPASASTTTVPAGGASPTATGEAGLPATPAVVQLPAARVGPTAVPCEPSTEGVYQPSQDCFVALNNGNILVFAAGSLRCTDRSGQVVAEKATKFAVGVAKDPLVLVVDDVLVPTCTDLSYAKNVLADGSETLDGLCGNSGTQINERTRRCFGHNTESGAMVAVVRQPDSTGLIAACVTRDNSVATSPISWSDTTVDKAWIIDSVIFDRNQNEFMVRVNRRGSTATATLRCG